MKPLYTCNSFLRKSSKSVLVSIWKLWRCKYTQNSVLLKSFKFLSCKIKFRDLKLYFSILKVAYAELNLRRIFNRSALKQMWITWRRLFFYSKTLLTLDEYFLQHGTIINTKRFFRNWKLWVATRKSERLICKELLIINTREFIRAWNSHTNRCRNRKVNFNSRLLEFKKVLMYRWWRRFIAAFKEYRTIRIMNSLAMLSYKIKSFNRFKAGINKCSNVRMQSKGLFTKNLNRTLKIYLLKWRFMLKCAIKFAKLFKISQKQIMLKFCLNLKKQMKLCNKLGI